MGKYTPNRIAGFKLRWPKRTVEERFFSRVKKTNTCWIWTGSLHYKGYGCFGGPERKAHRMSWVIHNGKIPKELFVLHKCDNRPCVNPDHLFLGTNQDNMTDMVKKGRSKNCSFKGEKSSTAKLSDAIVKLIRNDTRPKKEIAKEYGVHWKTISRAQNKFYWKHIK